MKIKYDNTCKMYYVLKKEMLFIGKLDWVIVYSSPDKQEAQDFLENMRKSKE